MGKLHRALWIYGGALLDCVRYGIGRLAYHIRKRREREQRQYCKRCGRATSAVWILCLECLAELAQERYAELKASKPVHVERPSLAVCAICGEIKLPKVTLSLDFGGCRTTVHLCNDCARGAIVMDAPIQAPNPDLCSEAPRWV